MRRLGALVPLALLLAATLPLARSGAEVAQVDDVRVGVDAQLRPQLLPRQGRAPISVSLAGTIHSTDGSLPPRLRTMQISINRHGRLDPGALPACRFRQIQPATTAGARAACPRSVVGTGSFEAEILIPAQSPFPSNGRIVAFNGRFRGRPAILAHVYGTKPAPTSFTLPFLVGHARGTFATTLTASLPRIGTNRAYVTGLAMTIGGGAGSRVRPYLSSGCPAPAGFPSATFPLVRASFAFVGAPTLRSSLVRNCRVRS